MGIFTRLIIGLMICTSMSISAQTIISEPLSVTNLDDSYGRKSPKIAVNAAGEIMVFWMRTGSEAFFISTLINGVFSTPVQIPFGGINPNLWSGSLGPNMASEGDDVYVTFEVYGDAIYVSHSSDAGETWGDPVAAFVPPQGRKATIPVIAVDADGQPYVAYVNTNNSEADAYYGMVRSTDFGETFLAEVDVSIESDGDEVCECCNGHIDVADNGDVYVAFRNNDNNLRDIWLTRSIDGGDTFTSAFDIDETDWNVSACPSNGPHFTIVNDEVVTAFFSGTGSDGSGAYYSTFDSGSSTAGSTSSVPLTDVTSISQNRPRIAGSGDTLAIVWQESYESSIEIAMSVSTTGAAGLNATSFLVSDMMSSQTYPSMIFSGTSFHIVYEDSQSGTVMYQEVSFGVLGINDEEKMQFQMGPNPCVGNLNIMRASNERDEIFFIDALGRTVKKEVMNGQRISLDVSNLKPGLYTVAIGDNKNQAQKLIIR